MDDAQILALYFQRDERAIDETEKKYGGLCRAITGNILPSREDGEECLNDAFLALWNAIPPAQPGNLAAYLSRIARNLALKRLEYLGREKRSQSMTVSLEELSQILPDHRIAPDVRDADLGQAIGEFLRRQRADARNVFVRKYYYFDSVREIAQRYSFTESKVKSLLLRTRNNLKAYLIKEGYAL
ncbi:MAG: sigma-70 family RNA polymerase sigma factor [Firmicutes bacterium]|nr:sigma-70 family RNA polymerase sigma factor [Bacillota bacterium]